MAITLNEVHKHTHSAEALFKVYTTEDLIPQRYEGVGARNIEVKECSNNGSTGTVQTIREIRADVPKALSKFGAEWNPAEQKETWAINEDGSYRCEFTINIKGVPVDVKGNMHIQPNGDGCTNNIELKVSCGIPLIGKIAEKFVSGDSKKSIDAEYAWIKDFLNS